MYHSIIDLPFVCRLNLPESAQRIYCDAFNQAWEGAGEEQGRYRLAQSHAWAEVRKQFERDRKTGGWVARSSAIEPGAGIPLGMVAEAEA